MKTNEVSKKTTTTTQGIEVLDYLKELLKAKANKCKLKQ